MRAITTKYYGPRSVRGSRYIADGGNALCRITVEADDTMSGHDNHRAAALALCRKMEWTGKLASGTLERTGQEVFVFVSEHEDYLLAE